MDRYLRFNKRCKLALFLLMSIVGMSKTMAQYQYGITIGELKYTLDDSTLTATVTGHKNGTNATGTLSFYSYVTYTDSFGVTRTYTVTEIGDGAFQYCRKLTGSLYIPNSVTTIGQWAFQSCSGLEYLNLGNSVTTIGVGAFKDCTGFRGNLIIPNSVVYIGNYSTYDDGAFEGCSGFTGDLNIPNSVTTIRAKSFKFCNGFTGSLTIPSSVTYIGVDAFYICDNFSGIYYTGNIAQWCGITFGNSGANPVDGVHRLYIDNTLLTHLVIPESVTSIKNYAFFDCVYLTGDLIIPNSVTTIGKAAFMYCNFTGNLTLGNSVTTIGSQAFMYCDGFTGSLTIPNSVTTIERGAFKNCSGFTGSLIIPNSVTTIGILNDYYDDGAFEGCSGFTGNLTIGNSVTIIGERSFSGCSGFTGNLTIGNSIMTIGDLAFSSCSNVESLSVFAETPPTIQSSSYFSPFYDCPKSIPVYVPCCSMASYQSANGWNEFTNYQEMECPNYTIAVEANPPEGGIFVGAGEYEEGATCTLTATPAEGYQFVNWTENDTVVSTNASYTFTVTGAGSYVAHFQLNSYQITASATPSASGSVSGSGTYSHGSSCTLTATANEGYEFVNWTENGEEVSTDAPYSFTVTGDRTLVANFTEIPPDNHWTSITGTQYNLTMSGVIYIDGVAQTSTALEIGAFCGDECRGSARAQHFPPTGEYVVSLAVVSNQQSGETITFRLYDHETQQEFPSECVNSITFVANANFGEMGNWYSFAFNNTVAIAATVTPEGAGVVEGVGDYLIGTSCTLTATANTGYTFVNWTKNGAVVSTNASYTFTVTEAGSYVAHFQLNSYQITVSATPSAGGSVSGAGTYNHGSNCTLTATNNTGYTFINWTENGEVVSTDNPYTFTVNGAVELTANFSLNSYYITASANPTEGGTITGTGTYDHFSTCTLTATANTGYTFQSWSVAGEVVSTENPYTFTVSGGVEVTANFDAQETTTLAEGWTWWSTSIELSDIDGLTMLEENLGHNGLMIKSANKFVQNYYPSTGYDYWFGQLTSDDFTNASSYMIQTSASCEVTMTGTYADPSDHPIQLYPGWTWIGYPCGSQQSATSAFAGFTPTANDKVKGQYAFSTYYDNYGWFPEFTMTPGEGYLYQSLASDTRTLTFANGSKDNPQPANEEERYWRNNVHTYADNMNVIAVVTVDGEEQQGEDLELGAFVDGECRGSAVLKYFQPTDRWYAMLTVTGIDGDRIEFGIINKGKGLTSMTSDRSLAFQANVVLGELDEPYTIDFGTLGCMENNLIGTMHIYPNPIDRNTAFSIMVPETETVRSIYIVNMMGEVVAHETNMTRSLAIQAQGVYTIKVVCQSGNVFVGKLIVK